ncbi:hypothetical protein [Nonomuraea sp. NPDC049480]|uniref:hypothetical protein n=1 Tax=Nonomuraea sp. NPDC049480 TaxID=3364353 RepID=UPI00378F3CED
MKRSKPLGSWPDDQIRYLLSAPLAAVEDKLAQLDERPHRFTSINAGIPAFREIVGRTAMPQPVMTTFPMNALIHRPWGT